MNLNNHSCRVVDLLHEYECFVHIIKALSKKWSIKRYDFFILQQSYPIDIIYWIEKSNNSIPDAVGLIEFEDHVALLTGEVGNKSTLRHYSPNAYHDTYSDRFETYFNRSYKEQNGYRIEQCLKKYQRLTENVQEFNEIKKELSKKK